MEPVTGGPLPVVPRLAVLDGTDAAEPGVVWALRGVTSNARYTRRDEQEALASRQADLGRPEATRAALIPITKSPAWWALAQDERRELLEETSHHIRSDCSTCLRWPAGSTTAGTWASPSTSSPGSSTPLSTRPRLRNSSPGYGRPGSGSSSSARSTSGSTATNELGKRGESVLPAARAPTSAAYLRKRAAWRAPG